MTEEAISRSEAKGTLTYGLDPVGNRQSLASTVTGINQQSASYNVNDQALANTYDANGNTLGANGKSYAYDSMDRMTSFNGGSVTMVYDGDGNRVAKTAGGVTTQYLVDELNPTGLPQVMDEVVKSGIAQRTYLYGLRRISQTQVASGTTSYYGYDAHGDVRYLMDSTGAVTDTYDYDAFGNLVGSTGTTPNVYRYQGEALDAETGLYYLRARYYDPTVGRFLNVDPMTDEGEHPYTYAGADPVNGHDPTGQQEVLDSSFELAVVLPSVPQIMGGYEHIKCIASMTLSVLSIPGDWMNGVTACQAVPVGHGSSSGSGRQPRTGSAPPGPRPCPDACEAARQSKLRLVVKSVVGTALGGEIDYRLEGTQGGARYWVFQLESNPSRTSQTPWGPGAFGQAENAFYDDIRVGPIESPNNSTQTFWAFSSVYEGGRFVPSKPYFPILVRDLAGNEFCSLGVYEDNTKGVFINGNLLTDNLRSFLPPH
jgi:RHS repeat-associated protein